VQFWGFGLDFRSTQESVHPAEAFLFVIQNICDEIIDSRLIRQLDQFRKI